MEEVKVSTKGQIVIPKYIRDAIGLDVGKSALISLDLNRIIIVLKPDDPVRGLEKVGNEIELKNIRREIKSE